MQALCEALESMEAPYCAFCWFLRKRFMQSPINGKGFVCSKFVMDAYREHLDSLKEATPGKAMADINNFSYLLDLYYAPTKALENAKDDVSALFLYLICKTMGLPDEADRFREDAVTQLKKNPYYFDVFVEMYDEYPIRREELYGRTNE